MNQAFAGITALVISLLLWGIGRKPQKKNQAINTQQSLISRTLYQKSLKKSDKVQKVEHLAFSYPNNSFEWPLSKHQRLNLQKKLCQLMDCGPEERLEAIEIAQEWGNPYVIPLLKKGLHDSDSRVVTAAATAINRFRGKTYKSKANQSKERPPRNVSRMR